jgi:hypothetical protein
MFCSARLGRVVCKINYPKLKNGNCQDFFIDRRAMVPFPVPCLAGVPDHKAGNIVEISAYHSYKILIYASSNVRELAVRTQLTEPGGCSCTSRLQSANSSSDSFHG